MSWRAKLQLEFDHDGKRTRLVRKGNVGPLYVQKPFYPEGDLCHVYLLHPPGVIAGNDHLHLDVNVRCGAHTLLTTPAATKFMRSNGPLARQEQSIRVQSTGCVEWLPQETIVFNNAHATSATHVQLEQNATYIGSEVLALARPANKETFSTGSFTSNLLIDRYCSRLGRYRPIYIDRQHYVGNGTELQAPWGLGANPVLGTLVATPADDDALARVRMVKCRHDYEMFATLVRDVLVIRYVGRSTAAAQKVLRQCWAQLRPLLLQRAPNPPAIWRT